MALTFRKFVHKETGEACYIPAGRHGNFLNSIKKLVNYVRYNIPRYYVLHLTLTVAENVTEIDYKHLHRVIQLIHQRLKRSGSDFKYIAVKEPQERGAVHYHILCVYSKPYVFPWVECVEYFINEEGLEDIRETGEICVKNPSDWWNEYNEYIKYK